MLLMHFSWYESVGCNSGSVSPFIPQAQIRAGLTTQMQTADTSDKPLGNLKRGGYWVWFWVFATWAHPQLYGILGDYFFWWRYYCFILCFSSHSWRRSREWFIETQAELGLINVRLYNWKMDICSPVLLGYSGAVLNNAALVKLKGSSSNPEYHMIEWAPIISQLLPM